MSTHGWAETRNDSEAESKETQMLTYLDCHLQYLFVRGKDLSVTNYDSLCIIRFDCWGTLNAEHGVAEL